jgi:hypothetical protein
VLRKKILAAHLATALRKLKASTKIATTRTKLCLDKNKKLTLTVSFFSFLVFDYRIKLIINPVTTLPDS